MYIWTKTDCHCDISRPTQCNGKKISDNVTSTNIQIIALYNQFQIKTIAIPLVTSNSVVSSSKWGIEKLRFTALEQFVAKP